MPQTPDESSLALLPELNGREFSDTSTLAWTRSKSDPTHTSTVTRSTDGVSFQPVASDPRLEVLGGTDDGDRIVLVGIRPKVADDEGQVILSRSIDGGRTWEEQPVGESLAPEWAEPDISVILQPSAVAFDDDTVVFTTSTFTFLDAAPFLTPDEAASGYRYSADGIAVLAPCPVSAQCDVVAGPNRDPSRTVDHVIPWRDLGIDPAATTRLDRQQHLYIADDGGIQLVDPPAMLSAGNVGSITATEDGFLAVVQRSYGAPTAQNAAVMHSIDGVEWTQIAEPPVQLGTAGVVAGRLAIVGPGLDGYDVVAVENDRHEWNVLDVDQLMSSPAGTWHVAPYESAIAVEGVTAVAGSFRDPVADAGGAAVSKNGVTMTVLDLGFQNMRIVDDATGEVIATYDDGQWTGPVTVDPSTGAVTVLDDNGGQRAVFTLQDGVDASNAVPRGASLFVVLHSDDLVHWSVTSVNEVIDLPPGSVESIGAIGGRPVIRVSIDTTLAPDAPPYVVLVGTPTR